MFSFLKGSGRSDGAVATKNLQYVLGLRFTTRSRAERMDLEAIEQAIRNAAFAGIEFDRSETGVSDFSVWLHVADPKRAFKMLSQLPLIAERMTVLQAAYADRVKLKFSILWPKGAGAGVPPGLG